MARRLTQDGERRTIRHQPWCTEEKQQFQVTAIREDAETPCVELVVTPEDGGPASRLVLTDVGAEELSRQLQAALSILPSSK